jgi:hypothetical protein
MIRRFRLALLIVAALLLSGIPVARAQAAAPAVKEPGRAIIRIYRIAPGKQLDFLKWMAENDAIAKEAGVPATVLYAHTDGDSWDYLDIAPDLTEAQQTKVDDVTKKHGRKVGFPASLEFRTFVSSHTDTKVLGPMTAADLVAAAK